MNNLPAVLPSIVQINNRRFPFTSYAEVSAAYCAARDATGATSSGETGPRAPDCALLERIYGEEYCVGFVSYNGKVWIFDPHEIADLKSHRLVFSP